MSQRTCSVGVVIYKGNKVLLVRHTESARLPTDSYGFPAGRGGRRNIFGGSNS